METSFVIKPSYAASLFIVSPRAAVICQKYFELLCYYPKSFNPDGGIYKAGKFVFSSVISVLVAFTGFTPFSIEITQPGLPSSSVHK